MLQRAFWRLRPRSAWLGVVGLKKTWVQKLSSCLILLTIHDHALLPIPNSQCRPQEFNECLLYGVNAACAPGACHNDIGANSCTFSSGYESVEEDGKLICRIGVRGVAPK